MFPRREHRGLFQAEASGKLAAQIRSTNSLVSCVAVFGEILKSFGETFGNIFASFLSYFPVPETN